MTVTENEVKTEKITTPKGQVYINRERCKGCGFCIEFCPFRVLEFDTSFNSHGYHPPVIAESNKCTGCDLCGMYCPDFAIFGIKNK